MKQLNALFILIFAALFARGQTLMPATDYTFKGSLNVGGKNGATDPSAWMEIGINGTNRVVIIPRVNDSSAIPSPKVGSLMYYNPSGDYYVRKVISGIGRWERIATGQVSSLVGNGLYKDADTIKLGGTYNAVMLTGANMWYNVVGSPPSEYTLNYQAPTSHNLTAGKGDRGGIFNVAPSEFKYVSQKPGDAQSQFKVDSVNLTFRDFSDNDKSDVIKVSIPDSSISIAKPAAAGGTFSILARDSVTGKILQADYGDFVVKQTQNPTSSISPTYRLQRRTTDTTLNVNYTYGRLAANSTARATDNINTVVVDGISRTFSNPSPGSSGSGSISITYTPNNTRTIPIVVTTADGKTSPAASISISTTFTYYIGYSLTATPTTAELWAGINSFLAPSNTRVASGTLAAPPGPRYIFFAYPASLGTANVIIGGTPVGYITTPTSVQNTTLFTESFNVVVSPNATNSGVTYQIN